MPSAVNACQAPLIGRYGLWPNFLPLSERPEFMHEPIYSTVRRAVRYSLSDGIPFRSGCVALVVGSILNLINQGDAILGMTSISWIKIVLTYFVPYAVSTYGAVSYRMSRPPT